MMRVRNNGRIFLLSLMTCSELVLRRVLSDSRRARRARSQSGHDAVDVVGSTPARQKVSTTLWGREAGNKPFLVGQDIDAQGFLLPLDELHVREHAVRLVPSSQLSGGSRVEMQARERDQLHDEAVQGVSAEVIIREQGSSYPSLPSSQTKFFRSWSV